MNYKTDGFNERTSYIRNANDMNRLNEKGPSNFDNSFAQMKSEERKTIVETVDTDVAQYKEEVRGNRENFILRNNNMRNANMKPTLDNPISNALNRNLFKR